MVKFEIIHRKRKPIKTKAIIGLIIAFLIIILTARYRDYIIPSFLEYIIFGIAIAQLIISYFILGFSYKTKNVIGYISFSPSFIDLELPNKKERIEIENIKDIKFELDGYESLNKAPISEMFKASGISYHSGLNNFVKITSKSSTQTYEFYLANKNDWTNIKKIDSYFQNKIEIPTILKMPIANPL